MSFRSGHYAAHLGVPASATLKNLFYANGHDVPFGSVEFIRHRGGQTYDLTFTRYGDLFDDSIGDGTVTFLTPSVSNSPR